MPVPALPPMIPMGQADDIADTDRPGDVLTVADLNSTVSAVIEDTAGLQEVRCLGEVSEVSRYDWGVFVDLVYDGHDLTALMWAERYRELDTDIEPGMEVVVTGAVEFYAEAGRMNLKPWDLTVVGEGERALQREQLRAELEARGWTAEEHRTPLPTRPERVGVVTSADGDARDDIQEAVHSRYSGVDILVQDARVQGERAPASLAGAVRTLDRQTDVDVIVVGRGGGSETDLAAFDTEAVAEAVFTADTPVIAAVGHRDDEPLVYRVADATAITPTEAGAAVVPDRETLADRVADLRADLDRAYRQAAATRLDRLGGRLTVAHENHARTRLRRLARQVDDAYATVERRAEVRATRRRYRRIVVVLALVIVGLSLLLLGVLVGL